MMDEKNYRKSNKSNEPSDKAMIIVVLAILIAICYCVTVIWG